MERSAEQEQFEKSADITQNEIYRGKTISLRTDILEKPDGSIKKWDIVNHPGAVVLVPITNKGEVILIKQWRHAIGKRILELPAGTLELGEPALACAQRELQEETGFASRKIISLGGFYSTPGFCTEYLHLFLATNLYPHPLPADDDEKIDQYVITLQKALKMIEENEIDDAKTIVGIQRYVQWSTKQ